MPSSPLVTRDIQRDIRVIRLSEEHARYTYEMERHFDVYFGAVVPREEDGLLIADYSEPAVHTYRHNGLQFKIQSLPEEPDAVEGYFKHAPDHGALAFDVGAYCGLSTYELSKRFDRVIAFEPDTNNRVCLIDNICRHKLGNVTIVPAAMTAFVGKTTFYAEGCLGSRMALPQYVREPLLEVATINLVAACQMFGVPDFITMDIEGAEIEVLAAARDLLTTEKISLAIDTNHEEASGWTVGRVEAILMACDYEVETEMPGGFYTTFGWK